MSYHDLLAQDNEYQGKSLQYTSGLEAESLCLPTYYVDIPSVECVDDDEGPMINVGMFKSRQEAIVYAKEHFGADDEGKICLVSG